MLKATKFVIAAVFAAVTAATVSIVSGSSTLIAPVESGLSAAQYFERSQSLSAQADIAYPQAFMDLPLWTQTIAYAQAAVAASPENTNYLHWLGMVYTETKWWIRANDTFVQLESRTQLDAPTKHSAAFVARKLAVMAMDRGDKAAAKTYLERSKALEASAVTDGLLKKLEQPNL